MHSAFFSVYQLPKPYEIHNASECFVKFAFQDESKKYIVSPADLKRAFIHAKPSKNGSAYMVCKIIDLATEQNELDVSVSRVFYAQVTIPLTRDNLNDFNEAFEKSIPIADRALYEIEEGEDLWGNACYCAHINRDAFAQSIGNSLSLKSVLYYWKKHSSKPDEGIQYKVLGKIADLIVESYKSEVISSAIFHMKDYGEVEFFEQFILFSPRASSMGRLFAELVQKLYKKGRITKSERNIYFNPFVDRFLLVSDCLRRICPSNLHEYAEKAPDSFIVKIRNEVPH